MSAAEPHPDNRENAWRRLPDSDADMGWQLAHTEALFAGLEAGALPTLRWYAPAEPALVLGRSQGSHRLDLTAAHGAGVPVYRRTSGGGAVFVDRDALNLDVALPAGHPLADRDLTLSYRWIGEIWAEALYTLGIAAARAIPTEEVRAIPALPDDSLLRLACYGTLSPWEVVAGGRKVVGLSQIRRRPGAVYPIGVHLSFQPERLGQALVPSVDTRRKFGAAMRSAAAGLDELAGRSITAAEVVAAVERALTGRLGIALVPGGWLHQECEAAERLEREVFRPER
jgi:lipoate-protein ligase A